MLSARFHERVSELQRISGAVVVLTLRVEGGPATAHARLPLAARYVERFKLIAGIPQRLAAGFPRFQIEQRHHNRGQRGDEYIQ